MIMYTPIPPEILWYKEEKDKVEYIDGIIGGIPVQLKVTNGAPPVIERVLSTDPAHYLHVGCQPGRTIKG